jgi:hypothetical protein
MRTLLREGGQHVATTLGLANRKSWGSPEHRSPIANAIISKSCRNTSSAESYTLSKLPEGYALFHVKRRTETGNTAGRVQAENAVFVRTAYHFLIAYNANPACLRDPATLTSSTGSRTFICILIGCWTTVMICKITVSANARRNPHRQRSRSVRGLNPEQMLRMQAGRENIQTSGIQATGPSSG